MTHLASPPNQQRQRRRISFDWHSDPICVEVPPCPSGSGKGSKRSTPSHTSPLLSPASGRTPSPGPLNRHEFLRGEPELGVMMLKKPEPHVRHNIFQERSKLPANFHPHSHSNPDSVSNRSSYFSMLSSAASFIFRSVLDVDGETGTLFLTDTSTLMQPRVGSQNYRTRRRDCYNLHSDHECCEDCAEPYEA